MRNLKRALSLTLASVMLLGMMVVGSSALSFNDADDISNVTAATVLQELGVMVGNDGNFMPDAPVSRAQMAILICRILYGPQLNISQFEGTSQYSDVPVYEYYNGYINLATQLGVINGYGDGRFGPDDTVTTAQAALMLCRALGWFQAGEMTGNWGNDALTAIAKATDLSMFGNLKLSTNALLSRDNVAEMVFNAITKSNPVQYSERWDNYYTEEGGVVGGVKFNYQDTLGYKNFDLVYDNKKDDEYGRPSTEWGIGTCTINAADGKGNIGTAVIKDSFIKATNDADLTYTDAVKLSDIYKDLGKPSLSKSGGGNVNVTYEANGKGARDNDGDAVTVAFNTEDSKVGGKGTLTQVFRDKDTGDIEIHSVKTYAAEVVRVRLEDGEYVATLSVKNAPGGFSDRTITVNKDAFAADDVVLVTLNETEDELKTIVKADKITGDISALSTDYLRVDGDKYDHNQNKANESGYTAKVKDTVDVYLDSYNNAIYVAEVEGTADQYLYIKGADKYFDTISARVVLADGTIKVVELDGDTQFTGTAIVADSGTKLSDASDTQLTGLVGTSGITTKAYKYTESGGKIKLTSAALTTVAVSEQTGQTNQWRYSIEKNNATLYLAKDKSTDSGSNWSGTADTSKDASVVANADTVYVMVSDGKTYTGFRNVPSMDKVSLVYAVDKDNTSLASVVFITAKEDGADEDVSYFYIKDESKYEEQDGYTVWTEAYVDGEKVEIKTKDEYDAAGIGGVIDEPGIYKAVKTNDKDQITEVDKLQALDDITGVQATVASGGTLVLDNNNLANGAGTGKTWTYDSETLFISIDKDGKVVFADKVVPADIVKKDSYANGDSVYYIYVVEKKGNDGKDATTAKTVYVVEAEYTTPKTQVDSVTITGAIAPVKDAKLVAPAVTESTVAIVSYQWHDNTADADKSAGDTIAGSTVYKLTITLKIADGSAATHEFGTMNAVKIGGVTGSWDSTAKTLTFTFTQTGA